MLSSLAFHRTGLRLLALVRKIDPALLPVSLIYALTQVAGIYVGLALTAGLVDALVALELRMTVVYATALVLTSFVVSCVCARCKRRATVGGMRCAWRFSLMLREKALSLSYETAEDPKLAERIAYIERTAQMHGSIGTLPRFYRDLIGAAVNMLTCVSLVVALAFAQPVSAGALGFVASPAVSVLLLALVLLVALGGNTLVGRFRVRLLDWVTSTHSSVENRITYLLNLVLFDRRVPKVARIYDMGGMLMRNLEKNQGASMEYFDRWISGERRIDVGTSAVNAVFTVASYALVAVKVLAGAITVGAFTQYAGALAQFGAAYTALVSNNGDLRQCCGYLQEFLDFMDMEDPRPAGSIPVEKRDDGQFELAFEHVSFRYPGTAAWVLRDVNLKIDTLGKLAVVGPNGAGKTTFIKLLCRLYDPTEGRITLNGVDIRKYDEEEYRDLFGVVFQDFKLFAFPVWENLAAGYDRAGDAALQGPRGRRHGLRRRGAEARAGPSALQGRAGGDPGRAHGCARPHLGGGGLRGV